MRVYFARASDAPIECKIMAVCRIFAGATVTNISDKATPVRAPDLLPRDRVSSYPVPAGGAVSYLSILIYRELILSPPVSYFRSRERVLSRQYQFEDPSTTNENFTRFYCEQNFIPRELNRRCILARYVSIRDSPRNMGQFKVEYIFALHTVFRYDDYLESCTYWMVFL